MPAVGERGRYQVAGRNAITAAVANDVIATLWNPHATKDIYVVWVLTSRIAGGVPHTFRRATTKGTPGSTTTPDIDNDCLKLAAPVSGAVLDLAAYSVQPGLDASVLRRFGVGTVAGCANEMWFPTGIRIKAGRGLAFVNTGGTAATFDVMFGWDE